MLESLLSAKNLRIHQSPGDGHCLLHSMLSSWSSQHSSDDINYDLNSLKAALYVETYTCSAHYVPYMCTTFLLNEGLRTYIRYRDYNTDFCDILPKILANLYLTHLIIINENPITKEVVEVRVECERHGSIDRITYVHRKCNHYNGVVLSNIINSDCDNVIDNNVSTRISYLRDYLLKLRGSSPGIRRSERKHMFQYYLWQPRKIKNYQLTSKSGIKTVKL